MSGPHSVLAKRIAKDKDTLKKTFTYRSLDQDMDRVLADTDRPLFTEANRAGHALYGVAAEFVLDCYYEKGALEPLVQAYSGQPYRVATRFDRLLQHLQAAKRDDLIERFWTSITRLTRAEFFYQVPRRHHGDQAGADEFKNYALEAYEQGIAWLTRLDRLEAAARLGKERETLLTERLPPLPTPTDRRRIDESAFWEVISAARSAAPTTLEQMAELGESLRVFGAAQIKRFGSFYAKSMRKLYHWNVWALAYAARGGCSDAAFEEFRTWLILQGEPALVELAITNPARAAERVPPDPDLPDGTLLPLIEEAYLLRKGSPLAVLAIDLDKPRGKEWTEATLATRYPRLAQRYRSAEQL